MIFCVIIDTGKSVLADITNGETVTAACEGQSSSPSSDTATPDDVSEPSVLVKASQSLEAVQKIFTEEAKEHIFFFILFFFLQLFKQGGSISQSCSSATPCA